jgi:putative ABC transport system permease protein
MTSAVVADLRSAWRALRHAPAFTAVAIGTLAGGLSLCIVLLTIANAYLLVPLPYPAAERLYSVQYAPPGERNPEGLSTLPWQALGDVVEQAIAWDLDVFTLRGARPESAPGAWVTPGFVAGLGITPAIGRRFDAADFQPGRPAVALVSHDLWVRRFGSDAGIVGRQFEAYVSDRPDEAETFTIVGVLPRDFWHVNSYTEVLAPLRARSYPYQVRLRPGVDPTVAAERISAFVRAGLGQAGRPTSATIAPTWRVRLVSTQQSYTAQIRPMLRAVGVAAGLVLLMACANVAVLQLLRAHRRQRELAVRRALGSSTAGLVRLLGFEALLLGAAATIVALIVTVGVVQPMMPLVERQLGRQVPGGATSTRVDGRVLAGAIAGGLLTVTCCALAPLFAMRRAEAAAVLAGGGRTATEGAGPRRARAALITMEMAASMALLSGSVLMIGSVSRMLQIDVGFTPERVYTAGVGLRQRSWPDAASRASFYERLLPRLRATAGVDSVSLVDWWPLQAPRRRRVEALAIDAAAGEGHESYGGRGVSSARQLAGSARPVDAGSIAVSTDYFSTLGIRLRDGRAFTDGDRLGAEPVAMVSETLARRLWPQGQAVGQRLRLWPEREPGDTATASTEAVVTIVGVSTDVRQGVADIDLADLYRPLLQQPARFVFVQTKVRHAAAAWEAAFARAVSSIDADLPLGSLRPLDQALARERARPQLLAAVLAALAAPAALIALIGLHTAMAYTVRQRRREVAIRLALGAGGQSIVALFVREGSSTVVAGVALGLLAAASLGRLLQSELFGVRPAEPALLGVTALLLGICGVVAIWQPARRAARTDPAVALRAE